MHTNKKVSTCLTQQQVSDLEMLFDKEERLQTAHGIIDVCCLALEHPMCEAKQLSVALALARLTLFWEVQEMPRA